MLWNFRFARNIRKHGKIPAVQIKKNTERRNEYGKKSRRTQLQSQSPYSHVQRTGTESILAIHAKQNQAEYRLCLLQWLTDSSADQPWNRNTASISGRWDKRDDRKENTCVWRQTIFGKCCYHQPWMYGRDLPQGIREIWCHCKAYNWICRFLYGEICKARFLRRWLQRKYAPLAAFNHNVANDKGLCFQKRRKAGENRMGRVCRYMVERRLRRYDCAHFQLLHSWK